MLPGLEIFALHDKAQSMMLDLIWTAKLSPPASRGAPKRLKAPEDCWADPLIGS
jgi:hypothetical protein